MLRVRVQREDTVHEQSPSLFPSVCLGPAARLTQRQEVSPTVGKAAGQGSVNHQSQINTSDDLVGKGGNDIQHLRGTSSEGIYQGSPGNVLNCEQTQWKCVPLLLRTHMVRSVLMSKDPRAVVG